MLVGMDLPLASGGTETGIPPESEEKHLRQSETADLWQPKWNENQTVLAAAKHTPDRDTGPLEGAAAARRRLGIVQQSQSEGCC